MKVLLWRVEGRGEERKSAVLLLIHTAPRQEASMTKTPNTHTPFHTNQHKETKNTSIDIIENVM
jgi:hypothetical protein